jgi:hypothetical protein
MLCLAVALAGSAAAAEELPAPELPLLHVHSSQRFSFRTPASWRVAGSTDRPDAIEASDGGELLARFLFLDGEQGYDSLHVTCMLERLAPENRQHSQVKYEYDFLSGLVGPLRLLDSAFVVTYDEPIHGHQRWRQRNVTLVGAGLSLCAITYAPEPVWKKQPAARALLDAVLTSVEFPGLEIRGVEPVQ